MLGVLEVTFRADAVTRRNLQFAELKMLLVSIEQAMSCGQVDAFRFRDASGAHEKIEPEFAPVLLEGPATPAQNLSVDCVLRRDE